MNGFDTVIKFLDRLSRTVHFAKPKNTDKTINVTDAFVYYSSKHHGLPNSILLHRDSKFRLKLCRVLMEIDDIQLEI